MKKKLDLDFREYGILGGCNPPLAHEALTAAAKIGTRLPCNGLVKGLGGGEGEGDGVGEAGFSGVAGAAAQPNETLRKRPQTVSAGPGKALDMTHFDEKRRALNSSPDVRGESASRWLATSRVRACLGEARFYA